MEKLLEMYIKELSQLDTWQVGSYSELWNFKKLPNFSLLFSFLFLVCLFSEGTLVSRTIYKTDIGDRKKKSIFFLLFSHF